MKIKRTIISQDYYPFGMLMPTRTWDAESSYRLGFNKGSEREDELTGNGNSYSTYYRLYDARLARWWSVDPKANEIAWQSPYTSMDNNPIGKNDPMGDIGNLIVGAAAGAGVEAFVQFSTQLALNGGDFEAALKKIDWVDVVIAAGEGALTSGASTGKILLNASLKAAIITSGELVKAGADLDAEAGFTVVGGTGKYEKPISDAAIDFFFDKAAKNLAESTIKGIKQVGEDVLNPSTFATLTSEGKANAKALNEIANSSETQKSVSSLFNFVSGGMADSGVKDVFKMNVGNNSIFEIQPAAADATNAVISIPVQYQQQ